MGPSPAESNRGTVVVGATSHQVAAVIMGEKDGFQNGLGIERHEVLWFILCLYKNTFVLKKLQLFSTPSFSGRSHLHRVP